MILSAWQGMASGRGLAFLQFVLDMLFPGNNRVLRLWHSKELADAYPVAVSEKQMPGSFLTSRVRIALTLDDDNSDISDIAPVLKSWFPGISYLKLLSLLISARLMLLSRLAAIAIMWLIYRLFRWNTPKNIKALYLKITLSLIID